MTHTKTEETFRILVVDNDQTLLHTIEEILLKKGYAVKTASDGLSAYCLLQDQTFDILLTDLNLAGMNGIELLDRINTNDNSMKTILMSSLLWWFFRYFLLWRLLLL